MNTDIQSSVVLVREIECRRCGTRFCICRRCWRGQRYCGMTCRDTAKQQQHREAQQRYRRTEKGRRAHCDGEKRRRMGVRKKSEQIVDDAGTTPRCRRHTLIDVDLSDFITQAEQHGYRICRCRFCGCRGVVVPRFPRRGYGRWRWKWKADDERYGEKA